VIKYNERKNSGKNLTWYAVSLPETDYHPVWELQKKLVAAKADQQFDREIILLLEHKPVFTLGRRGDLKHLKLPEQFFRNQNLQIVRVERGGFITYHGPGQLVVYPIVNLIQNRLRVVTFVEHLEEVMIRTAAAWGVEAKRNPLNRGIWVGDRKLGSIGIAVSHGISYHGFALNVSLSLEPFKWISPCGLEGVAMTSIARETDQKIIVEDIKAVVIKMIKSVFNVAIKKISYKEFEKNLF
jgi:lipoate-protein ligase B